MQQVKELRDRTQAGLNDCKSALIEAEGDMEKAVEIILKKGLAKSAKRAGEVARRRGRGPVAEDGKSAVIVEVNIQTDFAARNADFLAFVEKVSKPPARRSRARISCEPFPGGSGTIEDNRKALVGELGENITVRRWERLAVDGAGLVHSYVHMGGKVGVLLAVRAPGRRGKSPRSGSSRTTPRCRSRRWPRCTSRPARCPRMPRRSRRRFSRRRSRGRQAREGRARRSSRASSPSG